MRDRGRGNESDMKFLELKKYPINTYYYILRLSIIIVVSIPINCYKNSDEQMLGGDGRVE